MQRPNCPECSERDACITDADGAVLTLNYSYDANHNVTLVTDSQGNTLAYSYNSEGLLSSEIVTSSTGAIARTEFNYNLNQQVTEVRDYTVASGGTAALVIDTSYDAAGNITSEIVTGSGGTVLVSYTNSYSSDNQIISEVRNGNEAKTCPTAADLLSPTSRFTRQLL